MFVDDLFDKKTLTEAQGGGSPWHSEPEQQQMDANRRGRLGRERNAGLDEPDDAALGSVQTGNGVYEYTVPAGQESLAQELGLQQHRGHWVSRVPIQRANFQFGQPQFHKIPSQGVGEGYQFKGPFPFDVDHMHGGRGINLPKAETKKYFTDKKQWQRAVDDINSSKYDDNSDYIGVTGRSTVEINGREWARWSDAQQKGYIELSSMAEQGVAEEGYGNHPSQRVDPRTGKKYVPPKSPLEQGVAEGLNDLKNIDPGELAGSTLGGIAGYMAGDALGGPMVGFGAAGVGSAVGGALAKEGMMSNPEQEDSPVAQAIIRRILMQRTDLLAKHGPEKVGAAVDEVADFVGDVDEIGSSDVSGWVRHVEQMLGNMEEDVAEGNMISKIKAPAAPSSPALAAPRAPAVAETLRQIDRMLESVNSKKSAEIVRAYADQQFAKLGLRNTTECKQIMAHVVHESAVRRRAYAQRMAK